ncbi:MAG TPA: FxSxx-COOH system tetratricopeptide repeat protein [Streptosporangiaceae bacterium]|nr:FxSxx-COOH system tetratricopeptide repeat protein [Streptosporangiaceae bacterium]
MATTLSTFIAVSYVRLLRARYRKQELATEKSSVIEQRSPAAYSLLCLLACFAHAPVDLDMLQTVYVLALTNEFQRILTDPDYLMQAADELSRMSLAEIDVSRRLIRLQRTAQLFTRGRMRAEDPETARNLERQAQSMLAASDPGTPDRDDTEEAYWRSRQHLIATGAYRSADPAVRKLIINQLRRLYRTAAYSEGVALGEIALRHWREASGGDTPETLALAVETSSLLWRTDRWAEARTLNEETLEQLRSRFGTDDQVYLLCARNRGIDLALLGDYQAALDNDLGLLPSFERAFGLLDLETLQLRNNIAISLRCLGRYGEALRYDEGTYTARLRILGREDTSTLTSRFAIARDLRQLGQVQRAHSMLTDIDRILGRDLTLSPQFRLLVGADLAVSLRRCGYNREALIQAERILRQYEQKFGRGYRDTLRVSISVINDFRIAGRARDARELGDRTVSGWTSLIGADHPNTLAAQATLACALRAAGDPAASLRLNQHVAAKFTEMFGETHPSTLTVLTNLATDLAATGEVRQARQLGERSYRLHARIRGDDHPFTLATAENLCLDRLSLGDDTVADRLHAYTQRTCEVKLGVGHPESRMIAEYRRMTLDIEPMMD